MNASSSPRSPARRFFLRASLLVGGSAALLGGAVFLRRGISDHHVTESGKEVLRAVAQAVLSDLLPQDPQARVAALDRHVANLDTNLGGLPPALRNELSALLGAIATVGGRVAMTGMFARWNEASVPQVQAALEKLRMSPMPVVQSAYHGLRDLTTLAFFGDSANWKLAGYPGPLDI